MKKGNMKNINKCFNIDSSATAAAGLFGVPCITTYLESSAGVESGGRTGFSMVIVALCFLIALFFTPLAIMIPSAATAPAIIYIGVCMFMGIKRLDLNNFNESFPAFICITFTILASNIANGICVAIPVYIIIKLANKEYDIPPLLYFMAAICMLYFYSIIIK